ncbi:hypothetical protein Nepgr_017371 [Nepenthes gracilis]|uniref:Uncharacterized protein n=1 Tax=Nepenthes gracilis TaxID=150966 RepID=A0AAD3SPA9_NEPGR|nr:hypothetical protein Nepgr_017371 [Nepenthes gracilis]
MLVDGAGILKWISLQLIMQLGRFWLALLLLLFLGPEFTSYLDTAGHDLCSCCYVVAFDATDLLLWTAVGSVTGFRLVADVDWPSLFEYCGDGAAYWGVVDVTSLLQLRTVLASVLGWLADDLATAFDVLGTSWPILLGISRTRIGSVVLSCCVAGYDAAGL